MKIVVCSLDNGKPPGVAYQCMEALKFLGHETTYINCRMFKMHKNRYSNILLNELIFRYVENHNPDIFFVTKGANILPGYVRRLSGKGVKTVNWTLDEPFGRFSRYNKILNIEEYDFFFVFDPYYLEELRTINPNSYYLPCAADPFEVHKEVIPVNERTYPYDLSFVGSHDSKRENILNNFTRYNIKVSGYRWDKVKGELRFKVDPRLYCGQDMCRIFNQSRINLNIHADHSIEGVNLRTFEIPASNSFQLCDYFKEISKLFREGREIVCYRDVRELKELADYYLDKDNQEMRESITKAGHERVLKEHTIRHRMEKMLEIVK